MKNELIQLLTERVALLTHQDNLSDSSKNGEDDDVTYLMAAPEKDAAEQTSLEEEFDSVLVDFDFDIDKQKDFDRHMTLRIHWNDWKPLYSDVF